MHWILQRRLKKLSQHAEPDPRFVRALEARLHAQMKPRGWQSPLLRFGAALASLVCIVGGTTGAYAYESEQVVPGHFLYPVRERIEHIEEQIAITPEKRVEVAVKHIERRIHEYGVLNRANQPIPPEQVAKIDDSIQRAVDDTLLIDAEKAEVLPVEISVPVKEEPLPANVPPIRKPELQAPVAMPTPVKPLIGIEKPESSLEQKIQRLNPQTRLRFEQIQKERQRIMDARSATSSREGIQRQNGEVLQSRLLELQRRIEMERRKARMEMLQMTNQ